MVTCLFIVLSILITNGVHANIQAVERDALSAFKRALIHDYNKCTLSWDQSLVNPCTWFHIECDKDNRVTQINLGQCNMMGSLVPNLANLEKLQIMNLYGNALTGSISPDFGKLVNLRSLDLSDNFLRGSIPKELGKLRNLRTLKLQDNNLSGKVPNELAMLFSSMGIVNLTNNDGLEGPCTKAPC